MTNQEAIERIKSIKSKVSLYDDVVALRMAEEALENQKTGYWIDDNVGHGTSCSRCGNWYPHSYLTKQDIIYCCKCGTKMEGE